MDGQLSKLFRRSNVAMDLTVIKDLQEMVRNGTLQGIAVQNLSDGLMG